MALLLEISGATLHDVHRARAGVEPLAARLLTTDGHDDDFDELEAIIRKEFPAAAESDDVLAAIASFGRRLVDLTGNPVLALTAGVLYDIICQSKRDPLVSGGLGRARYDELVNARLDLVVTMRARRADAAETLWRGHLDAKVDWI